ncbi:MAG: SpoIIE family protein phosphatase [Elusimicrobiales bacterium]|nr:SpoIIE family protein phosphatase [Elusimicrobiales bacterium]
MACKTKDLEKLLDVYALLTSTLDLKAVLTEVLNKAGAALKAEASNIMLLDAATGELVYEVALGEAGPRIMEQTRLKAGVGLSGWVAKNLRPLLVEDAYKDPRFFPGLDKKTGFHTKSVICVPLFAKEQLIGVAQVINKKDGAAFTPGDQVLFTRYCGVAAIAIDNSLLHGKALQQDRLQHDMRIAEEIQSASLPSDIPSIRNLRVECRSLACRYVAGDVVDITRLPDGRLAVLVADVSGKGVPAALFGAKFSADFEYLAQADPEGGALFNRLNAIVTKRSKRGIFITAVYAVIDPASGSVEFVNAGHLPPIIVGPAAGACRLAGASDNPPLGIMEDITYKSTRLTLATGERIVFMTDGVWDAKSPSGARLGPEKVNEILADCPELAVPRLMKAISRFTEGQALADDITVVGVGYGDYEERTFSSETKSLAQARKFVEKLALAHGFDDRNTGAILLALTEAVSNIIKHTYRMNPDEKIRIGVGRSPDQFSVHIRDWGDRQDPGRFVSRDLADIRPGGLGVRYIREVMDVVEFDDKLWDGNELHMLVRGKGNK